MTAILILTFILLLALYALDDGWELVFQAVFMFVIFGGTMAGSIFILRYIGIEDPVSQAFIFIATLFLLGTIFGGIKCKKCGYKYYANLEDDREGVGYIRPCPNCKGDQ